MKNISEDTNKTIIKLVKSGKKIEAIKLVRQESGLGLKDAKDYVESMVDEHNKDLPDNQKIGKSGCLLFFVAGIGVMIFFAKAFNIA